MTPCNKRQRGCVVTQERTAASNCMLKLSALLSYPNLCLPAARLLCLAVCRRSVHGSPWCSVWVDGTACCDPVCVRHCHATAHVWRRQARPPLPWQLGTCRMRALSQLVAEAATSFLLITLQQDAVPVAATARQLWRPWAQLLPSMLVMTSRSQPLVNDAVSTDWQSCASALRVPADQQPVGWQPAPEAPGRLAPCWTDVYGSAGVLPERGNNDTHTHTMLLRRCVLEAVVQSRAGYVWLAGRGIVP